MMSVYIGHLVTKVGPGGPANSLRLDATLTISQQNIVIDGTWIDISETRIISSVDLPSFPLNHTSVAERNYTMLNGSFLFNGSFQYNKRKPIVEDYVELSLSRLDNWKLSVCGWEMNKLGLFNISGGGMKNNADGSEYKVDLCKQYIYEKGTKLWKLHSIDGDVPVLCAGVVTSIDAKTSRIRVLFYNDGGCDWLSKDVAIKIAQTAPPKANADLSPIEIGYKISRHFMLGKGKTGKYFAQIISCHPESKRNRCTIRYDDDGYEEEMCVDVARHLLDDAEQCYSQGFASKPPVDPSFSLPDVATCAP